MALPLYIQNQEMQARLPIKVVENGNDTVTVVPVVNGVHIEELSVTQIVKDGLVHAAIEQAKLAVTDKIHAMLLQARVADQERNAA